MKYKLICFDLQGTLSNSEFSDYFWFEVLPELYRGARGLKTLDESKQILRKFFSEYGKYDYRYYSVAYWIKELGLKTGENELIDMIKAPQIFYDDTFSLVKELSKNNSVIILSTTVRSFLARELGGREKFFTKIYSCLDDFSTAGKTSDVFAKVSGSYGVRPEEAINIGDNPEMDISNAKAAGWGTFFFDKKEPRDKMVNELRLKLIDNL